MNLPAKACLGAGVFLVLSGGLLSLTGLVLGARTDPYALWGDSVTVVESAAGAGEQVLPAFSRLDVDLSLGDVTVLTGEDYRVFLDGELANTLSYGVDGDTLRVRGNGGEQEFFSGRGRVSVTLWLPQGTVLEEADIHTGMGQVELEELAADILAVENDMGDVTLWEVEAGAARFTLSMGELRADGLTTGRALAVENSMGDVTLEGSFLGETVCGLDMGDLELVCREAAEAYDLDARVSMGDLSLNGESQPAHVARSGGPNTLEVSSGMGDISLEFG